MRLHHTLAALTLAAGLTACGRPDLLDDDVHWDSPFPCDWVPMGDSARDPAVCEVQTWEQAEALLAALDSGSRDRLEPLLTPGFFESRRGLLLTVPRPGGLNLAVDDVRCDGGACVLDWGVADPDQVVLTVQGSSWGLFAFRQGPKLSHRWVD